MRRVKMHILVIVILLCTFGNVYAADDKEPNLFPKSLGIAGKVMGKDINIRNHPSVHAPAIYKVSQGFIKVLGKNNDWYKVRVDGKEGWAYSEYIEVARADLLPYAKVKGEQLIEYGLQFVGTPYVWGGTNLEGGVDCSGFTQKVFEAFDIDISRVSYMQASDGKEVNKGELRTGDLIFFDTSGINKGNISHVGIYMGENQFIHSESSKGVTVSSLSSNYYTRNYVKAIRVF